MTKEKKFIVGIGASAGGLEVLNMLVSGLKQNGCSSYVIVQHLSPSHKSMLTELISRKTQLPVVEITADMTVEPDHIYVAPPRCNVVYSKGSLTLLDAKESIGSKPSIDMFFKSLAEDNTILPIGIILSGTGSDGALGIRAIKAAGGITLAQDPESAVYDGMPFAAIETYLVDLVASSENIANELGRLMRFPGDTELLSLSDQPDDFERILTLMQAETGVRLREYKENMIQRRTEKRTAALNLDSIIAYREHCEAQRSEMNLLLNDILINVTSFFRDSDAFNALKEQLMNQIDSIKIVNDFRVWVAGCSSGEEAYSIAILLMELFHEKQIHVDLQIFATDLDENALQIARTGQYAEALLEGVDRGILEKYFFRNGNLYEVHKKLRNSIIFSRHDITRDPFFIHMDMICCRNMFIYFKQELQQRLIPMFHYALNKNSILFMGKSETISGFEHLFYPLDTHHKIFQTKISPKKERYFTNTARTNRTFPMRETVVKKEAFNLDVYITESALIPLFSSVIIVDDTFVLQHVVGNINNLVSVGSGSFKTNLLQLIQGELIYELRTLLQCCRKSLHVQRGKFIKLSASEDQYVRFIVQKILHNEQETGLMMIMAEEENLNELSTSGESADSPKVKYLEDELMTTREHLQTVIEELETSNEELQSLNEELHSSNEELQSAYTELKLLYSEKDAQTSLLKEKSDALEISETALKELNIQLEERVKETVAKNMDNGLLISKIFDVVDMGICLTDRSGHFTNVNSTYCKIYGFTPDELIGQHFTVVVPFQNREILTKLHDDFIEKNASEIPMEWEVQRKDGSLINIVATASYIELDGNPYKITSITDVTHLKEIREEQQKQQFMLIQQSKLAALGEMIGSIAHQWRQPLSTLGLIVQNIEAEYNNNTLTPDIVKEMSHDSMYLIQFMSDTIDYFKSFFKMQKNKESFNIIESVLQTISIISSQYSNHNIAIHVKYKSTAQSSYTHILDSTDAYNRDRYEQHFHSSFDMVGYRNEFQHVILNLLSNGKDAIVERMEKLRETESFEGKLHIDIIESICNFQIIVEDNGVGIAEDLVTDIFEPYFSTKGEEKGVGIGLYITKLIVEQHMGGTISVCPKSDGATFSVGLETLQCQKK